MLITPLHQRDDRAEEITAGVGEPVLWRSGSCDTGPAPTIPRPTSIRSRDESVGRGMFRLRANWPKRRTPKNASRRINSVQRSPTSSSARPTDSPSKRWDRSE